VVPALLLCARWAGDRWGDFVAQGWYARDQLLAWWDVIDKLSPNICCIHPVGNAKKWSLNYDGVSTAILRSGCFLPNLLRWSEFFSSTEIRTFLWKVIFGTSNSCHQQKK
jgi:hypothetical protein